MKVPMKFYLVAISYFWCLFNSLLGMAADRPNIVMIVSDDHAWTDYGFMGQDMPVDFAREIQPILAKHCWNCHGPDEASRQADLRLDLRDQAIEKQAIVPKDVAKSQLIERVHSNDPEQRMPPASFKRDLNDHQRDLLRRWVAQGAEYSKHWAFEPPQRIATSIAFSQFPATNPIDYWVHERLKVEKITPAPAADRGTLIRRVSLDLTGLPPTLDELTAFLDDSSDNAYEALVDRLLATEKYAERMAMDWLDQARYADTNGYNNDEDRTMWPWRDWVIRSFHNNIPYDQFVVEQLAGDLLPNPTRDQMVATAFLRNQGHNTEGGIIPEEYRVEYVADRVHTTATVFLGLSMQCARCHDHKFDPISQSEYYQFFAFFNSLDEKQASYSKAVAAEPFIRVPSVEQEAAIQTIDAEIEGLKMSLLDREKNAAFKLGEWLTKHAINEFQVRFGLEKLHHFSMDETDPKRLVDSVTAESFALSTPEASRPEGKKGQSIQLQGQSSIDLANTGDFDGSKPFAISVWVNPISNDGMAILSKMDEADSFRGYDMLIENGKIAVHMVHSWPDNAIKVIAQKPLSLNAWHHVVLSYAGGHKASSIQIYVDSKSEAVDVANDSLNDTIATTKSFHLGLREKTLPFRGRIDELSVYRGQLLPNQVAQLSNDQPITNVADWISLPTDQQNSEQQKQLQKHYLDYLDAEYSIWMRELESKTKERSKREEATPAVMVMREMSTPRETFVLKRGQYDQPTDKVMANVPNVLTPFPLDKPVGRLELAKWLVDAKNPLTARVAVNRWWQNYFGTGLVKTAEDFGATGERPSHPELLDTLATKFIDSGWDIKALQKLIVMSQTYRHESKVTSALVDRDPENRLLARGPRYRLNAETIRDNALAISGLLRNRVGGPSVKPYQPAGLWEDVTVERKGKYVADVGDGLYRRSMYTFWKRTCPPPSMMSFDAPNREVCLARRARTNTPLQSLVLLNDPTYVEASRLLATQMIQRGGAKNEDRLDHGFRCCMARDPSQDEQKILLEILFDSSQRFRANPKQAAELIGIGATPADSTIDEIELASWTIVASTLLNLDETISKR